MFQKFKQIFGFSPTYKFDDVGIEAKEETPTMSDVRTVDEDCKATEELRDAVYDFIRNIRDPEKPSTLEDLCVVYEDGIMIQPARERDSYLIRVEFNPTVPHCNLATLIGLCIRVKLQRNLTTKYKLDIYIKKGAHLTEEEINKQINDKERIAAAMENPGLRELVETCLLEED